MSLLSNGRYRHGLRSMVGRDVSESGRAATPLELLYDLTFVAAFGVAASELAHGVSGGHPAAATVSFVIAMTTTVWAWTNFTWFASAFDNDDWLFRVLTMIQMAGVLVLAIGLPPLFASIESSGNVDIGLVVVGYVVIRVAVALQWVRAAHDDSQYRRPAFIYGVVVGLAQLGWILLALRHFTLGPSLVVIGVLFTIESLGPVVAEARGRSNGGVTPWNPHHLAERYALLTIIALGETVLGTLSAATQISALDGWTVDAVVVIAAGVAMSFALWWVYFLVPHGLALRARRKKVVPWAYGHIPLFIGVAATGAGLHVVGGVFDPDHPVQVQTAVVAIAGPVLLFMLTLYLLHAWLISSPPRNVLLHLAVLMLPIIAIVLAAVGLPLWVCLLLTLACPVTVIVTYELGGWRALEMQLAGLLAPPPSSERKA